MSELNGKNIEEVIAQGKSVIIYTGNIVVTDVRDLRMFKSIRSNKCDLMALYLHV